MAASLAIWQSKTILARIGIGQAPGAFDGRFKPLVQGQLHYRMNFPNGVIGQPLSSIGLVFRSIGRCPKMLYRSL